ncbi:MAG: hypothetical protein PIR53_02680 [Nocardioides alkalitolerans]
MECTVCRRPDVAGINSLLIAGSSQAEVGRSFGLATSTLSRHSKKCLPARVGADQGSEDAPTATSMTLLQGLRDGSVAAAHDMLRARSPQAPAMVREAASLVVRVGELNGELSVNPAVGQARSLLEELVAGEDDEAPCPDD